jgi:hypothetical protein
MHIFSNHQKHQIEVIDNIEKQIIKNSLNFTIVPPPLDLENDSRICLTSVHIPHSEFINDVQQKLITPLKKTDPNQYYYPLDSFHMTIKNVRIVHNPPNFNEIDIKKAKEVFSKTIPNHKRFSVYLYRLLLFPGSVALIGTTDEELDNIIIDLNKKLREVGLPDDKKYANDKFFFCNMNLARFTKPITREYKDKVLELSKNINFKPYIIDSVTLLTSNAVLKKRNIVGTWNLNKKGTCV